MSISRQDIEKVALLARLQLTEDEIAKMSTELTQIVGYVDQLGEVNTDGVEPLTAVIEQKLRLREDSVTDGNCREDVLANAPDAQHGFFAVPKVIE